MNSIIILTVCNIFTGMCMSQPINTAIDTVNCPEIVSSFNDDQRLKTQKDELRYIASCVSENQFPMEYFNKTTAHSK